MKEETKKKISNSLKGRYKAEENRQWKGLKVKNSALHEWLRNNLTKPDKCPIWDKDEKLSIANLKNHNYTRDLKDYQYMCYSCHSKLDNRVNNFKKCGQEIGK